MNILEELLAELRGAREIYARCPSTENERTVEICQQALDEAIDETCTNHRTQLRKATSHG